MPYTDRDEAARVVMGELPEFAHLPELPARGAGSDLVGRTAAVLVDVHVDLQPSGWRVTDRPGRDERNAAAMLRADLDALEIAALGYTGPLKVQVAGPLTLAAGLDRARGDRVLADHGARRDLAQSLAEGLREHVGDVARRIPGADVVVQLDEPSLPAVLAGAVPTISGFGRLRTVDRAEAEQVLGRVLNAVGAPTVVHCCASNAPAALFRSAGADAVSLDVGRLGGPELDELAGAVDSGLDVFAGVIPAAAPDQRITDTELADRVVRLWRRLDQDPAAMAGRTVITPVCGLAGADAAWARSAYTLARTAARTFADVVGPG